MRYGARRSAAEVKDAISPSAFYLEELSNMKAPRMGARWVNGGLCPFHPDTRPTTFRVNLETGAFTCYACGTRGSDVIAFLTSRDGCDFREALDYLERNYI